MFRISLSSSEVIKHQLFRAREHLQCLSRDADKLAFQQVAWSSYEFSRALNLPSVKHDEGIEGGGHPASAYLDDAISNLTTVIEYPIDQVDIDCDPEMADAAAKEILKCANSSRCRRSRSRWKNYSRTCSSVPLFQQWTSGAILKAPSRRST